MSNYVSARANVHYYKPLAKVCTPWVLSDFLRFITFLLHLRCLHLCSRYSCIIIIRTRFYFLPTVCTFGCFYQVNC